MSYTLTNTTFMSNNGINKIAAYFYEPNGKVKAVLQLSHGMCEYVGRYEHFAEFLSEHGIALCGNDHIGHGRSVISKDEMGYFGGNDAYKHLIMDLHSMTMLAKNKYPDLPVFMLGHSMGSFVARGYIALFASELDGAIICGTSGSNSLCDVGKLASKIVGTVKGRKYRSKFLNQISFGSYNKKFANQNSQFAWLSQNEDNIRKYQKDEYCNFIFTADGFVNLLSLLKFVSSNKWYMDVKEDLPILLISGDMDPVGNYADGVQEVYRRLKNSGISDVSLKLYKNMRHEILNETGKEDVYKDILSWINMKMKKVSDQDKNE